MLNVKVSPADFVTAEESPVIVRMEGSLKTIVLAVDWVEPACA